MGNRDKKIKTSFEFISAKPKLMLVLRRMKPLASEGLLPLIRNEILESTQSIATILRSDDFWEMLLAQGLSITIAKRLSKLVGMPKERRRMLGIR